MNQAILIHMTRTEISELGEFGLIRHLTQDFPLVQAGTITGIGDDAAVLRYGGGDTVISTDMLVEGVHFDLMYTPLKHLGYKSIIVSLSDICAMNAMPTQVLVSLAISNRFSVEALDEIYAGIRAACAHYQVDLVGGDTTSSQKGLIINTIAIGQADPKRIVRRGTAKPGDILCVTGDLGGAYIGLQLLEREKRIYQEQQTEHFTPQLKGHEYCIGRQLKPEARRDVIQAFAKFDVLPTSMMDISDGLAGDLMHICQSSGVGAYIEEINVPIHMDTQMQTLEFHLDPITCALSGGEDYELLFTLDPKDVDRISALPEIYLIGEITPASDGIQLHTKGGNIHPLTAQGWRHF